LRSHAAVESHPSDASPEFEAQFKAEIDKLAKLIERAQIPKLD
jgi:hypothetical protein